MIISPEREIPTGSNLNFVAEVRQTQWQISSSIQELKVILHSANGEKQSTEFYEELSPDSPKQILVTAEFDVKSIEFLALNGGTNSVTLSVNDIKYHTPDGESVSIVGTIAGGQ
jgi:hypothetical protein